MKPSFPFAAAAGATAVLTPVWAWAQTTVETYGYGPGMMWRWGWLGMFFGPLFMILPLAVVIVAVVLWRPDHRPRVPGMFGLSVV